MLEVILDRIDRMATEVGRIRRGVEPDSSLGYSVDRLIGDVESLDLMLRPTAGELHRRGVDVDDAIAAVDAHVLQLRRMLGARER